MILGPGPQSISLKVTQRCTVYCPTLPESYLATCDYPKLSKSILSHLTGDKKKAGSTNPSKESHAAAMGQTTKCHNQLSPPIPASLPFSSVILSQTSKHVHTTSLSGQWGNSLPANSSPEHTWKCHLLKPTVLRTEQWATVAGEGLQKLFRGECIHGNIRGWSIPFREDRSVCPAITSQVILPECSLILSSPCSLGFKV